MILKDYELNYKNNLPFQAELSKVSNLVPHRHDKDLELVYCLEGTVNLEAAEQTATLHAGQLHSIDFADIHCLWSDEDNTTLIFHLDLTCMPNWDYLENILFACEDNHLYPYQKQAMTRVKDIVLSLSYAYFTDALEDAGRFDAPLKELVDTLLQYFNWFNYENQDDYMNVELYERFHRVLTYCLNNYEKKITVSQIAAQENITDGVDLGIGDADALALFYHRCREHKVKRVDDKFHFRIDRGKIFKLLFKACGCHEHGHIGNSQPFHRVLSHMIYDDHILKSEAA